MPSRRRLLQLMIHLIEGPVWLYDFAARMRMQRRPRQQLLESQQRRFDRLTRYIWRRSPWYRRVMQEHGLQPGQCRPQDFPPLDKAVLSAQFDEIVTRPELNRERIGRFLERSTRPIELLDGR